MEFGGLRATILGLAREGTALARFLAQRGARVCVSDLKGPEALADAIQSLAGLSVRYYLGSHPPEILDADVLFLSPGVPPESAIVREAQRRGVALSSETRLFTRLSSAPVLGITGSSGKTTTVTLVGKMLEASSYRTYVGGNIGQPLIGRVDEIRPQDRVVMELSSFQLEGFGPATPPARAFPPDGWSPHGAAVLNITPNHLDRHPSMEAYIAAKSNILRFQGAMDWAVLNADDEHAARLRALCAGRVLQFSLEERVPQGAFLDDRTLVWAPQGDETIPMCRVDQLRLRGRHNVANTLAAFAIAGAAGASREAMVAVAREFAGVEHRLELVRSLGGVSYYNDSIATSPERAMAALRSFDEPLILLAGGRDKHLPWQDWASLVRKRVRVVICFGEMAPLLLGVLRDGHRGASGGPELYECSSLEEAVEKAREVARPGEVVLFSPGGTSFDAYADFGARGQAFRRAVLSLD
ncbi:MAG: UDP-N-acetylmuramoyl-L-alanine--D-glutamate ligase [Anaerolineae bacterium]